MENYRIPPIFSGPASRKKIKDNPASRLKNLYYPASRTISLSRIPPRN